MVESKEKIYEEIQLDFTFVSEQRSHGAAWQSEERTAGRTSRTLRRSGLGKTLVAAREALLDASLDDLSVQLLSLFEFCEASLTRALDVIPLRKAELFSTEEYRSLRGLGQAQWLLSDAHAKQAMKAATGEKRKRKKQESNDE